MEVNCLIKDGGNGETNGKVYGHILSLAQVRQKRVTRVDLVLEPVVIEHPDSEDVLAVVPDVQHEPPVINVADQQIAGAKHSEVRTHVKRVGNGEPAFAICLQLF